MLETSRVHRCIPVIDIVGRILVCDGEHSTGGDITTFKSPAPILSPIIVVGGDPGQYLIWASALVVQHPVPLVPIAAPLSSGTGQLIRIVYVFLAEHSAVGTAALVASPAAFAAPYRGIRGRRARR